MKTLFIRLRTVALVSVCILAVLAWYAATRPSFVQADNTQRDLPIYCVERQYKVAALSFDAAWGNEDTQQLIDILARYDVKATFFVVGDWARLYPESVKALADAGHEVMSHSDTHKHMPQLTHDQILDDINASNDAIEAVTGVRPKLFRAPYGEYDNKLIRAVRELGMNTIQWDVDSLDWRDLSAADIQKRVLNGVRPGSIVLFHNAAKHTPEALPGIIEALQRDGYQLVPVSEILLSGEFVIDHTGKQIPLPEETHDS